MGPDVRAVIDTNVFVPAVACQSPEVDFYNVALRVDWKVVVSEPIIEEYVRVIHSYGYQSLVVYMELNKLHAMNRCRRSAFDPESVEDDLAPRKDRHVVAPCVEGVANAIVTQDGGILSKGPAIGARTGARVLDLARARDEVAAQNIRDLPPRA